jgi:hypothetical protein
MVCVKRRMELLLTFLKALPLRNYTDPVRLHIIPIIESLKMSWDSTMMSIFHGVVPFAAPQGAPGDGIALA